MAALLRSAGFVRLRRLGRGLLRWLRWRGRRTLLRRRCRTLLLSCGWRGRRRRLLRWRLRTGHAAWTHREWEGRCVCIGLRRGRANRWRRIFRGSDFAAWLDAFVRLTQALDTRVALKPFL